LFKVRWVNVFLWDAYRIEDPRGSVPSWGIEDGPQVEEEHGCDTAAAEAVAGVLLWFGDLDVCTDDPETDGTTCGADEEEVTATDVVDEPEEPDKGYHGLYDTEDSSGEETGVGTPDTDLEDCQHES
jgi:hypothetical protein